LFEQQVHLAKCIQRLARQQLDVTPFRDVHPHTKHSTTRSFQFSFCFGEISFIDVGEDYFHTLTDTPFGYPEPDAARRTSNNRGFVFKLFHCVLLWIDAGSATTKLLAHTPVTLLGNSRKTECGAKQVLTCLAVRAAPFALAAGRGSEWGFEMGARKHRDKCNC
jgi:hypothetical protein